MTPRLYSFPQRPARASVKLCIAPRASAGVVIELAQYWRLEWGLF